MLEHTLEKISNKNIAPVELHCAPDISDSRIQNLASRFNIPLHTQQGQNLGERMSRALENALTDCSSAILIGTDCPALDISYIQQALEILQSGTDVVIGPAEDGG